MEKTNKRYLIGAGVLVFVGGIALLATSSFASGNSSAPLDQTVTQSITSTAPVDAPEVADVPDSPVANSNATDTPEVGDTPDAASAGSNTSDTPESGDVSDSTTSTSESDPAPAGDAVDSGN